MKIVIITLIIQTPKINNLKMPQIGWLEILAVVIVAILVLGPKEFQWL